MQNLIYFLNKYISKEIVVFILSMAPFIEVRGAIPIGMGLGINPIETVFISYLGSIIPMPFIIKLIRPIFNTLKKRKMFLNLINRTEKKSHLKWDKFKRYEIFSLFLFTAIPLPGTGVWSASLIASIMNLRLRHAILPIVLGNLVSTFLIAILSHIIIN